MCRTIRLKRSNEDKRKAVSTLLNDAEWSQRSDRWVSETAGVGHHLEPVQELIREIDSLK